MAKEERENGKNSERKTRYLTRLKNSELEREGNKKWWQGNA